MKKIDILINASILSENNTGLGVYTYNIIKYAVPELTKRGLTYEILCSKKKYLPDQCREHVIESKTSGFISRLLKSEIYYSKKYRMVWSTTQHGSLLSRTKQIITIHDITPLIYPMGRNHQTIYYRYILPILIKRASLVFTVSKNTKYDILNYFKVDDEKVSVVYCSIKDDDELEIKKNESSSTIKEKEYFVITGIHYEYKNIHLVIDAYKKYSELRKYKVFIIGNDKCEYGEYLKSLIHKYQLEDCFIFTGFISNDEKINLISSSLACIYPSLYEGFGLPVLEAMRYGSPVISSNASSLPEVGGEAALFFTPENVNELYERMKSVIDDKCNRKEIIDRGYENLKRFNWEDIIKNMINQIERIM